MKTYIEKLRDPRWQRKRLEIMHRDGFKCTQCGDTRDHQNVHHWSYSGNPWDVKNEDLSTVCETCHKEIEQSKKLIKQLIRYSHFRELVIHIIRLGDDGSELEQQINDNQITINKLKSISGFDKVIMNAIEFHEPPPWKKESVDPCPTCKRDCQCDSDPEGRFDCAECQRTCECVTYK